MYDVTINTNSYKKRRCSKKNWEPGTMNNYMETLNGWSTTESDILHVMWRLEMFHGHDHLMSEYVDGKDTDYGMSDRYVEWLSKDCNTITYEDKLCGFQRKQRPSGYGFMQGYFSVANKIKTLEDKGVVRVYFRELYDARQYYRNMDGCYMEIRKSQPESEKVTSA